MRIFVVFLLLLPIQSIAQRDFMMDYRHDISQHEINHDFQSFEMNNSEPANIPGYVNVLASAVIPGSGQMMQKQWAKGAAFLLVETVAVYLALERRSFARKTERLYHELGDSEFSVVLYADWIVNYNQYYGNNVQLQDLATPGSVIDPNNLSPNSRDDWDLIDIEKLRELERNTLFGGNSGNAFSHVLPDYGSQQYYELMSKYFQFGPGWTDFGINPGPIIWGKESMSPLWFEHGVYARDFNDAYRFSANMVNLIVLNHFVSFFDAVIGSRKRNMDFSADVTPMNTPAIKARFSFR